MFLVRVGSAVLVSILLSGSSALAAHVQSFPLVVSEDSPLPAGYGHVESARTECLDETARVAIRAELDANIERLIEAGVLGATPLSKAPPQFGWPLAPGPFLQTPGFHGISNFVDHAPATGVLLDYNCGTRTYDTSSGYDHKGTDIFLWPFSWIKMDNDAVHIVAGADGVIIGKADGNYDRNCALAGGSWNVVYVRHADGSEAWYGHLKSGSVTSKPVGAAVSEGEYLGIIGSSGNSTGVHLHFEIYDSLGNLIDPYVGPCNSLNASSWWSDQHGYYDSAINAVYTQDAPPSFQPCPQQAIPNLRNQFAPGEDFLIVVYYRDQRAGQVSDFVVRKPDGSVFSSWNHSMTDPQHYSASYWWWTRSLPVNAPTGTWQAEVTFQGETVIHEFSVGTGLGLGDDVEDPKPESVPSVLTLGRNVPNPFNPRTTIEFSLPVDSFVELTIHDAAGRTVRHLMAMEQAAGNHGVVWDGLDDRGRTAPSGMYFYQLKTPQRVLSRKMMLLR